jgi:hypothetical protein
MANVRPQLLFYGLSRNNIASYDQGLTREEVLDWIQGNSSWNRFEFSHPYNLLRRDFSPSEEPFSHFLIKKLNLFRHHGWF